jgi:hypothetical protein
LSSFAGGVCDRLPVGGLHAEHAESLSLDPHRNGAQPPRIPEQKNPRLCCKEMNYEIFGLRDKRRRVFGPEITQTGPFLLPRAAGKIGQIGG